MTELEKRFWSHIQKMSSGCWEWVACRYRSGHGQTWWNGKSGRAHRLSWELHKGPIPEGLLVCHKCDNPPCVNPAHLFLGTNKDNAMDAASKGRIYLPGLAVRWNYFRSRKRCPRGHRYSKTNTYINPSTGKRDCLKCKKIRKRQWDADNRQHVKMYRRARYAQSH